MAAESKLPFALVVCGALIRVAAQLVPSARQPEWKQEWLAEIWHRWHFLRCTGEWNRAQALRLVWIVLGSFFDGGWHLFSQHIVSTRLQEKTRSPWVCLGMLAALLAIVGAVSGGFAATRHLFFGPQHANPNLIFLWQHAVGSGGDRGLPPDAAPDWAKHSRLLEGAAGFTAKHDEVRGTRRHAFRALVITTEPTLFAVFRAQPALGAIPSGPGVVLDREIWRSAFGADPAVVGSRVTVGSASYRVGAVLPASFQFLSRQSSIFVVQPELRDAAVMVIARTKPGVTEPPLRRELTSISENISYYFFRSDLRIAFLRDAVATPIRLFGIAVLIAVLLILAVTHPGLRHVRTALQPGKRAATVRRAGFLLGKTALALAVVFTAGLEWSRSPSALLFASRDPGSGPFLLWLYILGAMGVVFWSVADQRGRCRVCLRLLCFPVRIGCPGCLLLEWSGTELLCAEGHGVLHVPHLVASWEEETEHWITLDDSWRDLFAGTK